MGYYKCKISDEACAALLERDKAAEKADYAAARYWEMYDALHCALEITREARPGELDQLPRSVQTGKSSSFDVLMAMKGYEREYRAGFPIRADHLRKASLRALKAKGQ